MVPSILLKLMLTLKDKVSRTPLGTPVRDTATPGSSPEIESTESWGLNGLSKHPPGAEEQGAGQPEPREQEADERALTEDEIEVGSNAWCHL